MPDVQKAENPIKPVHPTPERKFRKCPNPKTIGYLKQKSTGKCIPLSCRSINCPVCGPRQVAKIRRSAINYFKKYTHSRMWTLTLQFNKEFPIMEHYKILKYCWKRFITELRRTKTFNVTQRKVKFFKCLDIHATGYIHLHVIVNVYIQQSDLQKIWEHICQETLGTFGHTGQVWCTGVGGFEKAANYVTKYMTKALKQIESGVRKWSKSIKTKFFEIEKKNGDWCYVFGVWYDDEHPSPSHQLYLTSLVPKVTTSQKYKARNKLFIELFSSG